MDEDSSPAWLLGGGRARIEVGGDVALVAVRASGREWIVIVSARPAASGVGLVPRERKSRARAVLARASVRHPSAGFVGLSDDGAWLARDGREFVLSARGGALREEVACEPQGLAPRGDLALWAARGEALLERLEGSSLDAARRATRARIAREDARLARRVSAVTADLAKVALAEESAEAARIFVGPAARAPRGTRSLDATDWTSGEPVVREMAFDAAKLPREQIEALFARARRLKRGALVARARLDEAEAKRARLRTLGEAIDRASSIDGVEEALALALQADPSLVPSPSKSRTARGHGDASPRVPYRTFVTDAGATILVGRGAADNDALTTAVAKPHDLWLHAKGTAGAHVVVPLPKGRDAPAELLVEAAHLAAHFSDRRDEAVVDVSYTARRYVRKRRGAPPGQVQVEREKVIVLRVEAPRLKALLARERDAV